jgi:phosphatidylserine/phosphatidylglycerophosphate/cardiolipin synthase-like enzyme
MGVRRVRAQGERPRSERASCAAPGARARACCVGGHDTRRSNAWSRATAFPSIGRISVRDAARWSGSWPSGASSRTGRCTSSSGIATRRTSGDGGSCAAVARIASSPNVWSSSSRPRTRSSFRWRRRRPRAERAEAQEIASAVSEVATGGRAKVLAAHEHRPALRDALREARRELIIISPWLATAAVDGELLGWIDQALRAQKSLRIRIGYGIEPVGKAKRPARDQEDALRRIHKIAERSRGRLVLVEIGNTHEKIVICDESYAIVTSFNFLSFKPRPGRGVRLETGMVIEDPAAVRELRRRVSSAMDRPRCPVKRRGRAHPATPVDGGSRARRARRRRARSCPRSAAPIRSAQRRGLAARSGRRRCP